MKITQKLLKLAYNLKYATYDENISIYKKVKKLQLLNEYIGFIYDILLDLYRFLVNHAKDKHTKFKYEELKTVITSINRVELKDDTQLHYYLYALKNQITKLKKSNKNLKIFLHYINNKNDYFNEYYTKTELETIKNKIEEAIIDNNANFYLIDHVDEEVNKNMGAEAGEIDWHPQETIPEDYYAY